VITKESIFEAIINAKDRGVNKTDLGIRKRSVKETIEKILSELEGEEKIVHKGSRYFMPEFATPTKKILKGKSYDSQIKELLKDYVKRGELQDAYSKIAHLKEEIERAFDYVNDIYFGMKKRSLLKIALPTNDDLLIIYDNINALGHYGDSVPIPLFKDEVVKKFNINEDKLNEILLSLDDDGTIYLQTADRPDELKDKDRGIKFQERFLYFVTWVKR
jgi:hypothetical protein